MITIKDHGTPVRGRSPETIARRLYGRRAIVRATSTVHGDMREYNVLTPAYKNPGVHDIQATWWLDEREV